MTGQPAAVPATEQAVPGLGAALRWPPGSDKFRLLAGVLLGLSALYGLAYLAVSIGRGWPAGFGDSFALWSWGRFAGEHPAQAIYDYGTLRSAQLALGMDPGASYPFGYPPSFLLVLRPLGALPGWLACAALIGMSLPLWLWATLGQSWRSPLALAVLAMPTTALAIVSGQTGLLAGALLAGGARLAASNPVAGGVLLGLLSFKPQFGVLVPVALAAARLWRTFAAAGLTAIGIVLLTGLVFGFAIWPEWARAIPVFSRQFAAESSEIRYLMVTILPSLLQLGAAPAIAQLGQLAASAAAAGTVWLLFRAGPTPLAAAGLLVATLIATPYGFVYDLPILATALVWLVAERQAAGAAFGTGEVLIMVLAMLAPVTQTAGKTRLPLVALSLVLLLGLIVRRHRELRSAAAGPSLAMPRVGDQLGA